MDARTDMEEAARNLVAERDALKAECGRLRAERDGLQKAIDIAKDMAAKIMSASQLQVFLWALRAATACAPPASGDAVMQRPSARRFNGGMPDPDKEE